MQGGQRNVWYSRVLEFAVVNSIEPLPPVPPMKDV